jgi:hypothetical protein
MFINDFDHISFAEWLVRLNECAVKAGYRTEQPFTQVTGQLDWHSYYEEGLTPVAALESAPKDGSEFEEDYHGS